MQTSDTRTVHVAAAGTQYDISVAPGLLKQTGPMLRNLSKSQKAMLITDSTVWPLHADTLMRSLKESGFQTILSVIPAGEQNKALQTLLPVYQELLCSHIDRNTPLLALGGGVVGDMAGFVAATLLRGVPLVQIPTTLLAMVDASVGGKTGVNHTVGKNLIGAFHQPIAVLIDPETLLTLAPRELRGGLAECIKHDLIRDAHGFDELEQHIDRALGLDMNYLTELVAHNVAIKASVVSADPFEHGVRAHLNFGHTFAHAIENVSNYAYSHGEAVGLGIVAASHLAQSLGMIDEPSRQRMTDIVARAGLPTGGLWLDPQQVVDAMAYDKKIARGHLRFILPQRIGSVIIRDDIPRDLVLQTIQALRS